MDANISRETDVSTPNSNQVLTDVSFEDIPDLDVSVEPTFGNGVDQRNRPSVINASIDLTVDTFHTRTFVRGAIDLSGVEFPTLDLSMEGGGTTKCDKTIQKEIHTPIKRKLPLPIGLSPPKVVRLHCSASSKPVVYPSVYNQPNPHNFLSSNHTVTSADFDDQLQPRVKTSQESTNGLPSREVSLDNSNMDLPILQTNINSSLYNRRRFITPVSVPLNHPLLINEQISTTLKVVTDPKPPLNNSTSQTLAQPTPYYQLLDMFPDIDENFLSEHCNNRIELEQIIEIILSMNNNYPKNKQYLSPQRNTSTFPFDYTLIDVYQDLTGRRPAGLISSTNIPTTASIAINTVPVKADNFVLTANDSNTNRSFAPVSNSVIEKADRLQSVCSSEDASFPIVGEVSGIQDEQNQQFDFLLGIFPDADPSFLETKSKLKGSELKLFISETLEKKDYPKIVIKNEEKPETKDKEQLTDSLNVEKFLELFPDPIKHFSNNARVCVDYGHLASEFMKNRYKFHSIKFIRNQYKELNFNLVKTCEVLSNTQATRTTKRAKQESCWDDKMIAKQPLPFQQEIWFIEHEAEIKAHVDGIAESQRVAYQQAEERGELIECGCCFSNVMFEDCATCTEGDLFCKTCVRRSTEIRVSEGFTTFPCLSDCGASFSLQVLQPLLNPRMFSKLMQRIQIDEVRAADIEGLEVCPFCEFATIPPPDTNIFACLNPDCLKESCRKCHKVNHIPQRCEEVENDDQARARKYIEDEMTKALVRECYSCKKSFIKLDGCNKMTCTCGARMCYICRQPVKDYKHFNGPNGSETQKCPLFSTEKLLHVDAVHEVAKKALEAVAANNPELKLKHDPTKLLPSPSKAAKTLPPGAVERPEQLLVQLNENMARLQPLFLNPPLIPLGIPHPPPAVPVRNNYHYDYRFAPDGRAAVARGFVVALNRLPRNQ